MRFVKRKAHEDGDSQKALIEAEESLAKVRSRTPEVQIVAKALREQRRRNHFADQVYIIMSNTLEGRM